jgi:hypothetical protein
LLLKGNRGAPAVAEGNAEQIVQLLTMWATEDLYEVWDGVEYEDAREFVAKMRSSVRPAGDSMTPDEKMRHENLFDSVIRGRNHTIELIIKRVIENSHRQPHYDSETMAKNAAHDIIRLFY